MILPQPAAFDGSDIPPLRPCDHDSPLLAPQAALNAWAAAIEIDKARIVIETAEWEVGHLRPAEAHQKIEALLTCAAAVLRKVHRDLGTLSGQGEP